MEKFVLKCERVEFLFVSLNMPNKTISSNMDESRDSGIGASGKYMRKYDG